MSLKRFFNRQFYTIPTVRGTMLLICKEVTHQALGAQRLPPDVALRTIDPGLQAHRNVLDLCSIELGREGK